MLLAHLHPSLTPRRLSQAHTFIRSGYVFLNPWFIHTTSENTRRRMVSFTDSRTSLRDEIPPLSEVTSRSDPHSGVIGELGFLGYVFTVELPTSPDAQQSSNAARAVEKYDPSSHILASLSPQDPPIIDAFEASISHVWSIWECLLLCEPILVYGPSAAVTSQIVWWLRDLLRPIPLGGDFRPFFTIHDIDHANLVNSRQPQSGLLLGVTNPFFEKICSHWPHILSLGSPRKRSLEISVGPAPGWTTKTHKRYISKDQALLKKLEEAFHGDEHAKLEASEALREHLMSRTTAFLMPLQRYLNTLIPTFADRTAPSTPNLSTSSVASTTPRSAAPSHVRNAFSHLAVSVAPSTPPPLRLKPFSEAAFLASLKANGTPLPYKSAAKRKDFYERWLRTRSFGLWLASQEEVVDRVLATPFPSAIPPQRHACPGFGKSEAIPFRAAKRDQHYPRFLFFIFFMSDHLNQEEEDLLQSALSDAFSPTEVKRVSAQLPEKQEEVAPATEAPAPATPVSESTASASTPAEEDWKAEYEHHLAEWRARSAEQREKAEANRTHWEKVREQEEKEGKAWEERVLGERRRSQRLSESMASTSGWESVRAATEDRASPSPADARDLTTGEAQGHRHATSSSSSPAAGQQKSRPDSEPESSKHEKWEEVPSELTSSYPSLTFPSDPHSPTSPHQHRNLHDEHARGPHDHHHHHESTRHTVTSAIFDSKLSTKTRVLALASSIGINLLLPFVNGVMLGFGEIFAKEVVFRWFGWKLPVTNVGIRARTAASSRK
ncbi:uncharacterized protein PHACADRAFT_171433 [Phanerochaete carnosa HHB-10118-sp]|uniref:UDENN domain-containing protein n=1 Tax=Phanerochaete carnosa (strain HHB-10118-sp) TaxID=650164 RepID=K5WFU5_PHACS|nr:uncharacterized protein PHACADRAFT_171433 [Phanerochaete carnosa HHB-10118-sp]EKM58185.1 hypothetical protein PHACADRAFT_171433 [Phanerochaete carnosa HHB-10118-sp]